MELRAMWKVVRRRWWLIALPALAAAAFAAWGVISAPQGQTLYAATVHFTAAAPAEDGISYEDENFVTWTASEYVVNGLVDWVRTSSFSDEVNERLDGSGFAVTSGTFVADNERSVMTLSTTRGSPEETAAVMQAAIDVLAVESENYFPQLTGDVEVVPLDEVQVGPVPPPLTNRLDPLLRFGLGLIAGVGLAFFVEYLDPTLHSRDEVEAMGLPVLAEIPRRQ